MMRQVQFPARLPILECNPLESPFRQAGARSRIGGVN